MEAARKDSRGSMVATTRVSFQLRTKAMTNPVMKVEKYWRKRAALSPMPDWIFSMSLKGKLDQWWTQGKHHVHFSIITATTTATALHGPIASYLTPTSGYCRRSNYASFEKYLFCLRNVTLEIRQAKLRHKIRKMQHNYKKKLLMSLLRACIKLIVSLLRAWI